jgi:hypothetical protein
MRRVLFTLAYLVALAASNFISSPAARAAPPLQDCSGVGISSPRESGDPVRGRVNISGSASIPNFQFYKVEYAAGNNPADTSFRNMAADVHRTPVPSGLLEVWDTTGLPDGPYTIRLTVVDIRGNFPCPPLVVHSVIIANRTLQATVTPTIAPTVIVTGVTGTTAAATASATRAAAPTIALPTTAARGTVTATNTLTDSVAPRSLINLDILPDIIQAVFWGVGGMLIIFVIVAFYMCVRWVMDNI